MGDMLGLGKVSANSLETMKLIYPDLAQPGVRKAGQALETVLDLCNTILLPLKLVNSNANVFFNHHMEKYRDKMKNIAFEDVALVPPSIGLKILDELLMVTNEDISDLFVNLLTNVSTISGLRYAHPSFIEVIKNLSEDEAKIINEVFLKKKEIQYVYITKQHNGPVPLSVKSNNVASLCKLTYEENSVFYMENLLKLGLIDDSSTYLIDNEREYELLEASLSEDKKELEEAVMKAIEEGRMIGVTVQFKKGRYRLNSYGKSFIESISVK